MTNDPDTIHGMTSINNLGTSALNSTTGIQSLTCQPRLRINFRPVFQELWLRWTLNSVGV